MTRDPEIRAALHALLDSRLPPGAVVIDEYGLGGSIADVAVFTPHALHVFEIKSDADTPRRLERQAFTYGRYCSTATLVVGRDQTACIRLVPEWWGVLKIAHTGEHLELIRQARPNPEQNRVAVACLLWASEAKAELKLREMSRGLSRLGGAAWKQILAESMSLDEVRGVVHRHISTREWILSRKPPRVIGAALAEAA